MSSVDHAEFKKFNRGYDYWWDVNGPMSPLHEFNKARVEFLLQSIEKGSHELAGKRILDVGCGGGILSFSLARLGGNVTGIDVCPNAIAAAKEHKSKTNYDGNLNFFCVALEDIAKQEKKFDLVVLSEVLEHVNNFEDFLKTAVRCVNHENQNEESIFITTINRNLLSNVLMIGAAEKIFKVLPVGTHSYEKFLRPSEVENALRRSKFVTTKKAGFLPIPHLFPKPRLTFHLSSIFTAVNYAILARPVPKIKN